MGSKAFLYLGLLVAVVLLISSEVAAKDLAETATDKAKEDDAKLHPEGGYGGYPGRGGNGGYPGRGGNGGYLGRGGQGGHGGHGGGGGYGGRGGGGYGGGCRYGCCGGSRYGRGCRCCSYAGEAVNANTEAKPDQN